MYSLESCGVGVGRRAANGFHVLAAFLGSSRPNHPVFLPDAGSVEGSQPLCAKTPKTKSNEAAAAIEARRSLFRA
jgi:hypothetical protein